MESNALNTCSLYQIIESKNTELCPYCEIATNTCSASLSSTSIDKIWREDYCSTDNYDNCALYLSKNLREK